MTWERLGLIVVGVGAFYYALNEMGIFEWVYNKLHPKPVLYDSAPKQPTISLTEFNDLKSDVDKLKLALNLKEFKR